MRSRVLISILAWLGYLAHTGLTLWAAWSSQWPLPIPKYLASPVGLLLVPAGALLYLTAVVSFRSLGWAIAHSSKQLVTNGIYRYCRHPQYAGWELVLLGVSIAGRSGLALLLSLALLAFFAALFVVINVMEHAQVLEWIGRGLRPILLLGEALGPGVLLLAAAAASSVTDNIPLAAMLSHILSAQGVAGDSCLWWSVVFGANLGGNLTPIGSASTLVAVTIIHRYRIPRSFAGFVKLAVPYALAQLALAAVYLWLAF